MAFEATTIIRFLQAKAMASGDPVQAVEFAKAQFGPMSEVVTLLKKEVLATGNIGDDPDFQAAGRSFINLLKAKSLIGKIQAAAATRKVPFSTGILVQQEAPTANWTGENEPIFISSASFDRAVLHPMKLAGIVPMTSELLKSIGANYESAISQELARAIASLDGSTFIDPTNAGVAGVRPASITHGVTPIPAAAQLTPGPDIQALIKAFAGDLDTAVFVTSPQAGLALRMAGFEGAGPLGGDVGGIPLVTSTAVPDTLIALVDAAGILVADDGVVLDVSDQALLATENGETLNLYQQNLIGIKATRMLNWQVARAGSVAYINDIQWRAGDTFVTQ